MARVEKINSQKVNVSEINIGADSAEKDHDLARYFVHNDAYKHVIGGKKRIIVGNRGVGKSAIFKYLANEKRKQGHIVLELSPEEYSYEMMARVLKKEADGSWGKMAAFAAAWQYLLYNLVFKELVALHKTAYVKGPMKKIYDYVRDNLKTKDINPLGMLMSYLKRIEGVKINQYEFGLKTRELQSLYGLEEIHNLIPSLVQLLPQNAVYIFIDELDKGWDSSEDAKSFVAGLFQAAHKMNLIHSNLQVYVSIRQELFDDIPQIYEDAQKIREEIEIIRWNEDELLKFMSLRIIFALPESKRLRSDEDRWNILFDSELAYRKTKSFNYVIDRTQLRPRELLQFCKSCIAKADKKSRINYDVITQAEALYSEQKIKDLDSEYRFQYPGLLNIFEIFRGKAYTYEADELDYLLLGITDGEYELGDAKWAAGVDYQELKRRLWQVGFLKPFVIGGLKAGRKSGSAYLGHYQLSSINLDSITRFQVHPAFRSYLSLKESKSHS